MGFLDKAKKLAEQAQTKLDDVQAQINERQRASSSSPSGGPATGYDQHGRPVPPEKSATPPHGDPLRREEEAPAPPAPPVPPAPPGEPFGAPPTPGVPATEPPSGPPEPTEGAVRPPAMPGAPAHDDDPYAPPKLTGGDPLAG